MQRQLIILLLLLITSCSFRELHAQDIKQQVIATAGGSAALNTYVIDFTVGEIMIATVGNDPLCTQGIQQPLPKKDLPPPDASLYVRIYPNPVQNRLYCRLYTEQASPASITITTITGQLVDARSISLPKGFSDHILSMAHLKSGMYVLTVRENATGKRMVIKLVKE